MFATDGAQRQKSATHARLPAVRSAPASAAASARAASAFAARPSRDAATISEAVAAAAAA